MLPPESTNVKIKFAQYHTFEDKEPRLEIAKKFIEAKLTSLRLFLISLAIGILENDEDENLLL